MSYPDSPPPRSLVPLVNPDTEPSCSGLYYEEHLGSVLLILPVARHGVIVLRAGDADEATGRMEFKGVSTFTEDELRWDK